MIANLANDPVRVRATAVMAFIASSVAGVIGLAIGWPFDPAVIVFFSVMAVAILSVVVVRRYHPAKL